MSISTEVLAQLETQAIELPSWAFGNSGTRFRVFTTPGTPRSIAEKIADAAQVNRYTGLSPSVALHIPWDKTDDYTALGRYAADLGLKLGTVNSNTFQDEAYKFGSLTHTDPGVRQMAIDHHFSGLGLTQPHVERSFVRRRHGQGATPDAPQHSASFESLEVLSEGHGGDAEAVRQHGHLDTAVLLEIEQDGPPSVELAH